jgi:hypothetical protein
MTLAHDRVINGLLKSMPEVSSPEEVQRRLSSDIEIVAPVARANMGDLWPAIWTLAAILERQFWGKVYVRCGLTRPLACPAPLGPRVIFSDAAAEVAIVLTLGAVKEELTAPVCLAGDARRGAIALGKQFDARDDLPTAIECAILAGFLGFAALARAAGIPAYREDHAGSFLEIRYVAEALTQQLATLREFSMIGLGQIGQAYLAVLFFWFRGDFGGRRVVMIDDDRFQKENGRTQLLLDPHRAVPRADSWLGARKVEYLGSLVSSWGAKADPLVQKIDWGFRRSDALPSLALLGLHDLEGRRMACAAGFDRLIESGVGTDLLRPRISWHAIAGHYLLGRQLFAERAATSNSPGIDGEWVEELKRTPGACGWVEFERISATAPSLGAAAAGWAVAELGSPRGVNVLGRALLWSACIPTYRTEWAVGVPVECE